MRSFTDDEVEAFSMVARSASRVAILVAQVDPDGIGAAMGLVAIFRAYGVAAFVHYAGEIGHPQSMELWRQFDLADRARPMVELDPSMSVALVDSSKLVDPRFDNRPLDPVIILDHHGDPRVDVGPDRFHAVRLVGASCTLVAELAMRLEIAFDSDLSTLLAIGIHSDTDGLTSRATRPADRHAYARLMDVGDQELMAVVSRFLLSERACAVVQRVLTHRSLWSGNILVAYPPSPLDDGEGEYLAIAADFLQRHEGARLVLVFAAVGEYVRVCARAREPSLPLGRILLQLFGPGSGAKECSGGALLPLPEGLRDDRRAEGRLQEFRRRLEIRLAGLDLPPA